MAEVGLIWRSDQVVKATLAALVPRMYQAVQQIRNRTVQLLNRSQPTRRTSSGRRVGLSPSLPGEAPKRLESLLIKSINVAVAVEGSSVIGKVGASPKYARRLELGFVGTDSAGRNVTQLPRPYLRRALAEERQTVAGILGGR